MKNPIKLSRGNSKIHRALIWNLPAGTTCPGSTEICSATCYAKASEVLHNNCVPQARSVNFELSKRDDFAELMIDKLKRARLDKVRIHESGDFYSQKYLDAWVDIISNITTKTFWAYTKSWVLDFSKARELGNFHLRYSIDASTKHLPKLELPAAMVSAFSDDFFVCPSTLAKGHSVQCMKDCSYCIEEPIGSLIFRPHGSKKALIGKMESELK